MSKSVFAVEDDALTAALLWKYIEEMGYRFAGKADNAEAALDQIRQTQPDLVIVDLSLKNAHGIEVIKDIKSQYPEMRVMVLSMHDEAVFAERALRAGALGYVTKQETPATLLAARVKSGSILSTCS